MGGPFRTCWSRCAGGDARPFAKVLGTRWSHYAGDARHSAKALHGSLSTYCRLLLLLAPSRALAAPSRGGSTSSLPLPSRFEGGVVFVWHLSLWPPTPPLSPVGVPVVAAVETFQHIFFTLRREGQKEIVWPSTTFEGPKLQKHTTCF